MSTNKKQFTDFQFRWNDKLGEPDCHYMTRWILVLFGYGIRLHYWKHSDDERHFHDHPWWMWIFIISGGYTDISPDGNDKVNRWETRFRKAEHKHTVKLEPNNTSLSLLITGPKIRNWGFWIPGRNTIMRPMRYFNRYKHHQCD